MPVIEQGVAQEWQLTESSKLDLKFLSRVHLPVYIVSESCQKQKE